MPVSPSKFSKTSIVFRTISRDTKPTWTNRITKDFNDLSYNVNINLFGKRNNKNQRKSRIITMDNQKSREKKQQRKEFFSQEFQRILKFRKSQDLGAKMFKSARNTKLNPQQRPSTGKSNSLADQPYGLSSYQYKKTICGNLHSRPSIHLKFNLQSQRKFPIPPTYYSDLQLNPNQKTNNNKALQSYHPFQSYTDRKVFQVGDKLDKIYQIQRAKIMTSPKRTKQTVRIDAIKGREEQPIKESSYLSYQIAKGQSKVNKKAPQFMIPNTPRDFIITRQVISEKRGCYR